MKPGGKSFLVYSTAVSADAAKLSRNISKKKGLNITDWSKQAIVDVVSFYNYETGKWEMLFEFVSSVQSKALPFLWRKLKIANQPAQKWKKAKKKKLSQSPSCRVAPVWPINHPIKIQYPFR